MREAALPLLACPLSGRPLALEAARRDGEHIMEGRLVAGEQVYPILRGIPRLLPRYVDPGATATAERFAGQWRRFDHMSSYQEEWLAAWLDPLGPADLRGRTVFEGGCGKGRHSVVLGERWGVRDLVALDLGDAVEVAFAHTRELANVHVVQGDLLSPPVPRGRFDVALSVGVLHHLPDPRAGFDALRATVRDGGKVAIWVYGHENNEWIVRFVDPLRRRVTSRLPHGLLQALTLPPSALLAAWTRLPVPHGAYLKRLGTLPLREVHNIVFDQLVTPLAVYLREDEVRRWLDVPDLRDARVSWHNQNSWRASATVLRGDQQP